MKLWVGSTDLDWFEFLSRRKPDEVNFWQPSAGRTFRVLQPVNDDTDTCSCIDKRSGGQLKVPYDQCARKAKEITW